MGKFEEKRELAARDMLKKQTNGDYPSKRGTVGNNCPLDAARQKIHYGEI